jgi:hypothetical protein
MVNGSINCGNNGLIIQAYKTNTKGSLVGTFNYQENFKSLVGTFNGLLMRYHQY